MEIYADSDYLLPCAPSAETRELAESSHRICSIPIDSCKCQLVETNSWCRFEFG